MALVSELLPRTGGRPDAGRTKVYDWLIWCFPWLNVHHRNFGEEQKLTGTVTRRNAHSGGPQG